MRRVRYQVAVSLDGFIAGPGGEFDWIPADPDVDFAAMYRQFDTLLVGRKTFEVMVKQGNAGIPGMKVFVVSRTLKQRDYPDATIVNHDCAGVVRGLRAGPGKDIWLFGGGELFRSLVEEELVDTVEPAVCPVLLGEGIPFLPPTTERVRLALTGQKTYEKSGIVSLQYAVVRAQKAPGAVRR